MPQLYASAFDSFAVVDRAGGCAGAARVRHDASIGVFNADQRNWHVEDVGGNLRDIGRQTLTHIDTALMNQYRAIARVHANHGLRLFQHQQVVAGAVFDRNHRHAAFSPAIGGIERCNFRLFLRKLACFLQVIPDFPNIAIGQGLPERCRITDLIEVFLTYCFRAHA